MGILGNIENQNAVIIDDIIDTGGTILKAVETLSKWS
ncbi:phosphoribosyltransferase family protein [Mycoplasmopsis cynos]|nr:phosphoribosyltransferase family protein [Mycoplasmopsis cynos]